MNHHIYRCYEAPRVLWKQNLVLIFGIGLIFVFCLSIIVILKGLNLNCRKYLHKFCSTSGILFLGGVCFCPQQYMCLFSLLQILFWKWSIISVFLTGFFSFGIVLSIASLLQVHESTGKQSQLSERKNQMVIVLCISQKEYFLSTKCSVLMIVIAYEKL